MPYRELTLTEAPPVGGGGGTKLAFIDALRGLAILGVVLHHTDQHGRSSDRLVGLLEHGNMGVQLFFVASAFTLFLSYHNRRGREGSPIRNFFIRRFFRIAPMYYLVGIGYYMLQNGLGYHYWLGDQDHITGWNILSNIFFIHGVNPYWINSLVPGGWSITVEMTFYAALPFLFARIRNIDHALILFIASLFVRVLMKAIITHLPFYDPHLFLWEAFLFFYFPNQLPVFALGIAMYFIIADGGRQASGKPLLALAVILLAHLAFGKLLLGRYMFFAMGFVTLGVALSRYPAGIIVNPVVNHIGKISFSMYLVHFAVLHWLEVLGLVDFVEHRLLNFAIRFALVLAVTIVASTVTYRLIEEPFQNLGKRLIKRLDGKALAAAVGAVAGAKE